MMPKTVTIEFSLVRESKKRTGDELSKEIFEAFSDGDIIIPWIDNVKKISLNEI